MFLKLTQHPLLFAIFSALLATGLGLLTWSGIFTLLMVYTQKLNNTDILKIIQFSLKTGFFLSFSVLPLLFFYRNYNIKKSWLAMAGISSLLVISLTVLMMAMPSIMVNMGIILGGLLSLSSLGLITSLQLCPEHSTPQKTWWVSSHIIQMLLLGLTLFYFLIVTVLKLKDINNNLFLTISLLQVVILILNGIGWWENKKTAPWSGFWVFLSLIIVIPSILGLLLGFSIISSAVALAITLTILTIAYGISYYYWHNYYLSNNN